MALDIEKYSQERIQASTVLLVDDDSDAVQSLLRALKVAGLDAELHATSTVKGAKTLYADYHPHAVVLDLCLDESVGVQSGFDLLRDLVQSDPTVRVVVLTGHGSIEHGVKSLRLGAANFLEKPASIEHLTALLSDGIRQARMRREYQNLLHDGTDTLAELVVGESASMQQVRRDIQYAGQTRQPVLITGETGTGKGLCAQAIHACRGESKSPFVRYQPNFAAADMVNSELFGHVRGAFTGASEDRSGLIEAANGGTLFLDEIDELPLEVQVSLLGVLQEKRVRQVGADREHKVDFRVLCATNRPVRDALEKGIIREDFYHRIAHFEIALPALRNRKEDLPLLAEYQLRSLCRRRELTVQQLSRDAVGVLEEHSWPGNVRELQAVVEGAAYRAQLDGRTVIAENDVLIRLPGAQQACDEGGSFHERVQAYQLQLINTALEKNSGNQVKAAKDLKRDRSTMRRILGRVIS